MSSTGPASASAADGASAAGVATGPLSGRRVVGEWTLREIGSAPPGGISLHLERARDGATVQLAVMPSGFRQAFWRTRSGDVFYRRFTGIDSDEAAAITGAVAKLLERGALPLAAYFPHLAIEKDPDDGEESARQRFCQVLASQRRLLGPPAGADHSGTVAAALADTALALPERRAELHFDAPGIAEFLAPELVVDGAAIAGHVLRSIYLPPVSRRQAIDYCGYVLEFESLGDATLVRLELRYGAPERATFGACGPLHLAALGFDGDPEQFPPQLSSLCSWILALVYLRGAGDLHITVPSSPDELRGTSWPVQRSDEGAIAAAVPHAGERPPALNLAIDADCAQGCTFCSVKSYVRPTDHGETELHAIQLQLQKARAAGVEEVRLNGIDPLAFSCVLDVIDSVRALGFRRLSVYSPARQFAAAPFRSAFLDRAPAELEITVPLYGVTAAVHEAVTGLPGSHAQVLAAIDALSAADRPLDLRLSTVIVKQNVHQLPELLRFAAARRLSLDARVPYPMRQTVRDPYADSALRESEIVHRFVDATRQLAPREILDGAAILGRAVLHPCLLFRVEQQGGPPLFGAHEIGRKPVLHGTQYRSGKFVHADEGEGSAFAVATVPCPHRDRCALATACAGEHYAVYSDLFGLDEFTPVTVDELYAMPPNPEADRVRRARPD